MVFNQEVSSLLPQVAANNSPGLTTTTTSTSTTNITDETELALTIDELSHLEALEDSINPHRSIFYILMLTIIVGGLQLSWCTEFSEGTPFLLSLGMSKHTLALIWIAGPLSGSIGQPIIGLFSDNSSNKNGRRRNFIISGCISTTISLIALSYSIDIFKLFFPKGTDLQIIKNSTIPFAAFSIYFIDFSIAVIQSSSRAYIVDNVPTHQQQIANAFAAILIGGFNILGFFLGSIKLNEFLPFLGNGQFQILATIASLTLILTTLISLNYIKERDPTTDIVIISERRKNLKRLQDLGIDNPQSFIGIIESIFKQTIHTIKRLSPQVKLVCFAEFFAWIGYFPMLFYTTTYVGDLYKYEFWETRDPNLPPLNDNELQWLQDAATRRGSIALLLHSITSFIVDIVLPFLVKPIINEDDQEIKPIFSDNPIFQIIETFRSNHLQWLTVRNSWYLSHILFIICMIGTFFIKTSQGAIYLFAILGITWGIALWAPFVLISEEISKIKVVKNKIQKQIHLDSDIYLLNKNSIEKYENYEHEAGIILGIHNVFVAAPQVISSLLSSILFALLSTGGDSNGAIYDKSLSWVFRFGGIATIGALILSLKVKTDEELQIEEEEVLTSLGIN
ncbi:hypothetical protein WICMUC_005838 [Wickerhamomyces mucosus]|uniref:Sucrose transporter n=1 Tax=Wickerhamomyces mucosus TaxID=1378264 RepID=A0A9P8T3S7_9ASCO|nr:hypothetical protein WICMUC_005838 [Wickerhamomyces mucosus]